MRTKLIVFMLVLSIFFTCVLAEENQTQDEPIPSDVAEQTIEEQAPVDESQNIPQETSIEEIVETETPVVEPQEEQQTVNETNSEQPELPEETSAENISETVPETPLEQNIISEPENETIEDVPVDLNQTESIAEENETIEIPASNQTEQNETEINIPELIKTILTVIVDKISAIQGQLIKITAQLMDENSTPVQNQYLEFYANNEKIAEKATDDSGIAEFEFNTSSLEPGTYTINVDFEGNAVLESSTAVEQIIIEAAEVIEQVNETINETVILNETIELNETILLNETINETLQLNMTNTTFINETLNMTNSTVIVNETASAVEPIQQCEAVEYEDVENTYGTCTMQSQTGIGCDNAENNESCHYEPGEVEYDCLKDSKLVTKEKDVCTTTGYMINGKIKINTENYMCSINEQDSNVELTCDSIFDGNGDGVCTSGESCFNFIVKNEEVSQTERNSEEEFKPADESFFLEKATTEVVEN